MSGCGPVPDLEAARTERGGYLGATVIVMIDEDDLDQGRNTAKGCQTARQVILTVIRYEGRAGLSCPAYPQRTIVLPLWKS